MATIMFESGSPLIGSPMTFLVTPDSHSSLWTFHRVMLRVYAKLVDPAKNGSSDYSTFDFSTPVESTAAARFDISSALRAVADDYRYESTPPSQYPYVKFRIEAWEEWMVDGAVYENQSFTSYPGTSASQPSGGSGDNGGDDNGGGGDNSGDDNGGGDNTGGDNNNDTETNLFTNIDTGAGWDGFIPGAGFGCGIIRVDGNGTIQADGADYLVSNEVSLNTNSSYKISLYLSALDYSIFPAAVTAFVCYPESEVYEEEFTLSKGTTNGDYAYYEGTISGIVGTETPQRIFLPETVYNPSLTAISSTSRAMARKSSARQSSGGSSLFMYALPGSFTDMERMSATGSILTISRFSRKPLTSPEVAFIGSTALIPATPAAAIGLQSDYADEMTGQYVAGSPVTPAVTAVTVPAGATVPAGSPAGSPGIYGIPAPRNGLELRFINSLGVHENVFLTGYPKREVSITTEQFTISRQETLSQFSRGLAVKSGGHERWLLSSGPLDEAWASWYVHELLFVRWAWLCIGGNYIPCHILPEETTTIADRQKADLLQVQFTAQLDIEGSPLL